MRHGMSADVWYALRRTTSFDALDSWNNHFGTCICCRYQVRRIQGKSAWQWIWISHDAKSRLRQNARYGMMRQQGDFDANMQYRYGMMQQGGGVQKQVPSTE